MKNDSFFLILLYYVFLVREKWEMRFFNDSQIFIGILKNYPRDELWCSHETTVISYNSVKKLWHRPLLTETGKSTRLKNCYKYFVESVPRWQIRLVHLGTCSSEDSFEKSNLSKHGSVQSLTLARTILRPLWKHLFAFCWTLIIQIQHSAVLFLN